MSDKPVQEAFWASIIQAIHTFAKTDLDNVSQLKEKYLFHVGDPLLRSSLARTLYGARWIYKLGLALLVRNEEQMAHVRAQLIDYASVCEGVLRDMLLHAIVKGHTTGTKYKYKDPYKPQKPLAWRTGRDANTLRQLPLNWLIEVAADEKMVTPALQTELHWLRKHRNAVHISAQHYGTFLSTSRKAFSCMGQLFRQTQKWKSSHP